MSEITFCEVNTNNFNMENSKMNSKSLYMEEPLSINENCNFSNISKTDFSNLTLKEKAMALYYTQEKRSNTNSENNSNYSSINNIISNKAVRSRSEIYPHSQWSTDSFIQQKNIINELAQSVKLYNDDVSLMIKDLFNVNPENIKTDINCYDIEDFFKYSLIIGQQECSISEKLIDNLRQFTKCIANQTQEITNLQEKLANNSVNKYFSSIKKISQIEPVVNQQSLESYLQKNNFNHDCIVHLEEIIDQMDNSKIYYQNQIHGLLSEIHQRDELLDCYQKREKYLFNTYYPELIEKIEKNSLSESQDKEVIINEMTQQLEKIENAFQEELIMKNNLIEEIKNQKSNMETAYLEKLKNKDEVICKMRNQFNEKEKKYQEEINQYKKRFSAQTKLAEQIRSQVKSQQIEYCKKMEEMQQSLDSRGKIIAYVQNKLNIRENELKIANIKFTTAERQMNIEKDQYKREIANLKEEIEKSNEDIEELENELDSQEEEHKEELERLENEHDFQINKLWNIIDQRENTISEMEIQMEDLKEKTKNLEQSLSKYENHLEESEEELRESNGSEEEEINSDDMNERSNITVTADASEEIIILNDDYTNDNNARIVDQDKEELNNSIILTPELTNDACEIDMTEDTKTELTTTEERYDDEDEETNSLTLTEDMNDDGENEERREFIEEEEEDNDDDDEERNGEIDLEREIRIINEESEQLKQQFEIIKQDNANLRNELEKEKENLKKENEKCKLQQKQYEDIILQYSQICNEKEDILKKYTLSENENKKREKEQKLQKEINNKLEQQVVKYQKERDELENRVEQLEKTVNNAVTKEQYDNIKLEKDIALENVNEQRRKKNYLKQKLANQQEKNKVLIELIKKERVRHKEEIKQLKQSCVKQNGKIKAVLKQVKDGLVTADHIDLDRIVKRMKSERLLMNNEYERLKKVTSTLSIKSNTNSKKQIYVLKNENYTDRRKDLNCEGSMEIHFKNPNSSSIVNNESKILIKVSSNFESMPDESLISKQANDSLNSIESIDDNQELEEFNLKNAFNQQGDINYQEEDDDQNSFVDFTIPSTYDLNEKKDDAINPSSFTDKENISLILGEGANKMTPQQINLYNRVLQIPGVLPFNINAIKNFDFDDSNFSISSDSSMYKEGDGYMDNKKDIGSEPISPNRIRYNSYANNELKNGNNHNSLRRMPNFDQIAKLTQIKIKRSTDEIIV